MDYSKFYTPPEIANLLIKQLNISSPESAIDICCGSCNLLHAAKKRWRTTRLIGIDVSHQIPDDVEFFKMDGRRYAIQHANTYPLVLANPPFDYLENNQDYSSLYIGPFSEVHTSRLEVEMLLANLLLLSKNGTLLIIMPSTFVEAERSRNLRSILGSNYHVKSIIKLPDNTFGAAKIKSYALIIMNKVGQHQITKLFSINKDFTNGKNNGLISPSEKSIIPQASIRTGDWVNSSTSYSKEGITIRRGNISSHFFSQTGTPILHTAKKKENWEPSIRYASALPLTPVYAEAGDIIVSRIGKSAGQWYYYSGEKLPITDCLYCIKDPDKTIFNRIQGKHYSLPQKGVATRYITMKDFITWYLSLKP